MDIDLQSASLSNAIEESSVTFYLNKMNVGMLTYFFKNSRKYSKPNYRHMSYDGKYGNLVKASLTQMVQALQHDIKNLI